MELLNFFLNLILLAVWAIAVVESANDEHLVEEAFRLSLPPSYIRDKWLADAKKQKEADEKSFKKELLKAENKHKKNGVEFAYENHEELMENHLELQQSSQKLSTAEQAKQMLGAIEAKFLLGQQLAKEEEWMLSSALASSLTMEGKAEDFLAILEEQIKKSSKLDQNGKHRLKKILSEIEGEMSSEKFKMAIKDVYGTNIGDGMAFRLALKALGVKMVDMTDEQVKLYFFYCRFYKNLLKLLMVEGPNGPKHAFLTSWLEKMVKLLDAEILATTVNNNDPFKLLGSAYDEKEEEREKAKKPSSSWAMWKTSSAKGKNTLEEEEKVQTKHEVIKAEREKRANLWADLLEGN